MRIIQGFNLFYFLLFFGCSSESDSTQKRQSLVVGDYVVYPYLKNESKKLVYIFLPSQNEYWAEYFSESVTREYYLDNCELKSETKNDVNGPYLKGPMGDFDKIEVDVE